MTNAAPALLALLVVCSLATVAVAVDGGSGSDDRSQTRLDSQRLAQTGSLVDEAGTTNQLTLDGDVRSEYTSVGPDLGTTLAITDDVVRTDYDRYVVDSDFDRATTEERIELVETAAERIDERIDDLESRERAAVNDHAAGERSNEELIQIQIRTYSEASELSDALDELDERADAIPGYSFDADDQQGVLETFDSPVRAQLHAVTSSQLSARGTIDVAIATSDRGYSISTLDGSEYVRETTRFDNRDTTSPDRFDSMSSAADHAEELYPWAFDERTGRTTVSGLDAAQLYRIQVPHAQGDLDAFFDGGTGEVYHEVQVLSVDELPITASQNVTADEMTMSINETVANGPIEVTVVDEETGEPVTATIDVDGFELGETDEEGVTWLIPPYGEFNLTATTDRGTVNATVVSG